MYRAAQTVDSSGVIDGDLIEAYLELSQAEKEQVVSGLQGTSVEELTVAAQILGEAEESVTTVAIALPADDAMLWAVALTGLSPSELQCREGNEGA